MTHLLEYCFLSVMFGALSQSAIAISLPLFWSTHTHTCCVSFCAEEEIHLPTGGHCAHANCFEEPFFILYGAISSESLFENRQTLTLILELWHGGMQNAVLFTSLALCSGSATRPPRQFPGARLCSRHWDWRPVAAIHLMHCACFLVAFKSLKCP